MSALDDLFKYINVAASNSYSDRDIVLNIFSLEEPALTELADLSAQIEAQARQLESAREILKSTEFCASSECQSCNRVRAWLDATALQAEQEQAK